MTLIFKDATCKESCSRSTSGFVLVYDGSYFGITVFKGSKLFSLQEVEAKNNFACNDKS